MLPSGFSNSILGRLSFLGKNLSGSSETLFLYTLPVNNHIDENQAMRCTSFALLASKFSAKKTCIENEETHPTIAITTFYRIRKGCARKHVSTSPISILSNSWTGRDEAGVDA